ncbi:MAG: sugar phosphate isomerase/epimerase, partial [Ktedonobacteraceae bacterium]|nr:sugar phosphate isomerase/epimerase [Ktedonobacteraceae bacterium]
SHLNSSYVLQRSLLKALAKSDERGLLEIVLNDSKGVITMQMVLFTKLFLQRSLDEIAVSARDLGFDGIDLLIRPGFHVEPDKPEGIPAAVRKLRDAGLAVPMATTDLTDPGGQTAETLLRMCADADVKLLRLGYWKYDPARGYQTCLDAARRDLDGLETLARKTGVRLAIQLHGGTIHSSGPLTAALLAGHDPAHIGVYPDPGNQAVQEGREDWRLTFDVLWPWLCCIGVKNGAWHPAQRMPGGQRRWASDWVGIADGMVPWDGILGYLVQTGYDGLLSFHSHYDLPFAQVLDQTRVDLQFVRRQLAVQTSK